jgi:hypothetical protein
MRIGNESLPLPKDIKFEIRKPENPDSEFAAMGGVEGQYRYHGSNAIRGYIDHTGYYHNHMVWKPQTRPSTNLDPEYAWYDATFGPSTIKHPQGQRYTHPPQVLPTANGFNIQAGIVADPFAERDQKIEETLIDLIDEYHFNGSKPEDKEFVNGALFAYYSADIFDDEKLACWTRRVNDPEFHKLETEKYQARNG